MAILRCRHCTREHRRAPAAAAAVAAEAQRGHARSLHEFSCSRFARVFDQATLAETKQNHWPTATRLLLLHSKVTLPRVTCVTLIIMVVISTTIIGSQPGALALKATRASDLLLVKQQQAEAKSAHGGELGRDLRWPLRQVNVLLDAKTLNQTERQILTNLFSQLEHKTCLHIHKLSPDKVNPFSASATNLNPLERNFIYVFKSQVGGMGNGGRHPSMGLSSLGCVRQGRQSMVLTPLAFKWPELVLRYHVMRSLGVDKLERPDGQVRKLLNMLPLSQKITSDDYNDESYTNLPSYASTKPMDSKSKKELSSATTATTIGNLISQSTRNLLDKSPHFEFPTYFAYATPPPPATTPTKIVVHNVRQSPTSSQVAYLSDEDLTLIKELYNCTDYQQRLSPVPISELMKGNGGKDLQSKESRKLLESNNSSQVYDLPTTTTVGNGTVPGSGDASSMRLPSQIKLEEAEESLKDLLDSIESDNPQTFDSTSTTNATNQESGATATTETKINETLVEEAAKHIVDYLLASDEEAEQQQKQSKNQMSEDDHMGSLPDLQQQRERPEGSPAQYNGGSCKPLEFCPLPADNNQQEHELHPSAPLDANGNSLQERPMLLKLDDYHAQDPQLKQANQMKLSQWNNDTFETYRLMNNPGSSASLADLWPATANQQQQQQFGLFGQQGLGTQQQPKTEMLLSFEQSNDKARDPISALAGSQVLKLCSCSCQTMTPNSQQATSTTTQKTTTTTTTERPSTTTTELPPTPTTTAAPATTPITTTDFPPLTFPPFTFLPPTCDLNT